VTVFGASTNAANAENRELSHHVTWGADLVLFTFVVWYIYECTRDKANASWWPVYLAAMGGFLTIIDPTRHLLLDHGGVFFAPQQIAMYNSEGGLSPVGEACKRMTQVGLCMLLLGVLLHIQLPQKCAKLCS
jgi:hypothetical protein